MSHPPSHQSPHHPQNPHPGPQRSPFGPPAPPQGLSTAAKVALGGASAGTVLLVLLLVGYFVWTRPGDTSVVADPPSPSGEASAAPDPASAPEEPGEASEDRPDDASEEDSQDPGTPPDLPEFDVQEFSGTGNTTIEFEEREEPRLISMTHEGNGHFFVTAADSESGTGRSLVRRGGDYEGRILFSTHSFETVDALEIAADGAWEISVGPLSDATHWEATEQEYSGSGDEVLQLLWTPTNFATLDVTHDGLSNFFVASHDTLGQSMHVNEIGRYEGEIKLTPQTVVVAVEADGSWSITR